MKKFLLFAVTAFISQILFAQKIDKVNLQKLKSDENILKVTAKTMVLDSNASIRAVNDSIFIRQLVQSLKTPNSFYFPFDSLQTISHLYAPDSAFRIFTWQIERGFDFFRQRGAIQMNTKDGSLKLFPLFDVSDFTENPNDSVRNMQNWIGAIYYKIILKTNNNKKYYTLLGYDDNSASSTKKWVDVLTFDGQQQPQFGGKYFIYKLDEIKPKQPAYRFNLEYKKDGNPRLNYDPELDLIVFSHLVSETKDTRDKSTLIPDGEYEGFKWENGKWNHVANLFDYKIDMKGVDPLLGKPPVEKPLFDKKGKRVEETERQKEDKRQPEPLEAY